METVRLHRQTFRLLEGMAALILAFQMLAGVSPRGDWTLIVTGTSLVFVLAGMLCDRLRRLSWLLLFVSGCVLLSCHSTQVDGIILCLFAIYMVYDSAAATPSRLPVTVVLVASVLLAQIVSLFLAPLALEQVLRVGLVDITLGGLAFYFNRDLLGIRETLPRLRLLNYGLSGRELQILHLMWGGESTKEVAGFLGVSHASVRVALSKIYKKLGISHGRAMLELVHTHEIVLDDARS